MHACRKCDSVTPRDRSRDHPGMTELDLESAGSHLVRTPPCDPGKRPSIPEKHRLFAPLRRTACLPNDGPRESVQNRKADHGGAEASCDIQQRRGFDGTGSYLQAPLIQLR
jgi:hypothetical protein